MVNITELLSQTTAIIACIFPFETQRGKKVQEVRCNSRYSFPAGPVRVDRIPSLWLRLVVALLEWAAVFFKAVIPNIVYPGSVVAADTRGGAERPRVWDFWVKRPEPKPNKQYQYDCEGGTGSGTAV